MQVTLNRAQNRNINIQAGAETVGHILSKHGGNYYKLDLPFTVHIYLSPKSTQILIPVLASKHIWRIEHLNSKKLHTLRDMARFIYNGANSYGWVSGLLISFHDSGSPYRFAPFSDFLYHIENSIPITPAMTAIWDWKKLIQECKQEAK